MLLKERKVIKDLKALGIITQENLLYLEEVIVLESIAIKITTLQE